MKKSIAWFSTILILISVLSGCSAQPEQKETVEILINVPILTANCVAHPQIKDTADFLKLAWDRFASHYEKYNVKLHNDVVGVFEQTEYKENIPDTYGTKECPDLSFGGYFAMSGYIYDGHIIPLDDIITEEIRNDFSEATWELSKGSNGKTYMLPFYALQNILCYNKDLFRQCGLDGFISDKEEIQGWSLEEWETVLSTLKEKLPENAHPMMMYASNNQGDTHTMVMLRCKGSKFFDENGRFNLNTPEGIAGLQWFKDNYDKGYYPPQCEQIEIADCTEMFMNGQLGIYVWNSGLATGMKDLDIGYVNFPSDSPHGSNSNWITGFMAFDNNDPKKIEVVKDFLKFIYESEDLMEYSTCGFPCSKSVSKKWADELSLGEQLSENDKYAVDFTANNPNWAGVREAFWPHIHALLEGTETAEEAAAGIDGDCNKAIAAVTKKLHE